MVAVRRSGPELGEICAVGPASQAQSGDSPRSPQDALTSSAPSAMTSAPSAMTSSARTDARLLPSGGARVAPGSGAPFGFLHRVGDYFRRHRPSVAAALIGALLIPAIGCATIPAAHADPRAPPRPVATVVAADPMTRRAPATF